MLLMWRTLSSPRSAKVSSGSAPSMSTTSAEPPPMLILSLAAAANRTRK